MQSILLHFRRTANVLSRAQMTVRFAPGMWRLVCFLPVHTKGNLTRFNLLHSRPMANMWFQAPMTGQFVSGMWRPEHLLISLFRVHTDRISSVTFSHDGKHIVSGFIR